MAEFWELVVLGQDGQYTISFYEKDIEGQGDTIPEALRDLADKVENGS